MDKWQARLVAVYCCSTGFACLGVFAQEVFGVNPGPIAPVMSAVILLSGAGAISLSFRSWHAIIAVLGVGTGAEILGLFTGVPFGRYEYTDRWVPTVPIGLGHRFPLLLPLAWLLVVGGSFRFLQGRLSGWRLSVATGIVAAGIDVPMERAMVEVFGYWRWLPPGPLYGAPISNSLGWFVVATIASFALQRLEPKSDRSSWILPLFCGFVAWNGILRGFDFAWVVLVAFAVLLTLTKKTHISVE